jgi:hypothetical protein
MASTMFAAFLKDPKTGAGAFARRYRIAVWLAAASLLATGLMMRVSEITVIVLGANMLLIWLALSLFKNGRTAIWLLMLSEIMAAAQMRPSRIAALALMLNLLLLLGALIAARLAAAQEEA